MTFFELYINLILKALSKPPPRKNEADVSKIEVCIYFTIIYYYSRFIFCNFYLFLLFILFTSIYITIILD